MSKNRTLILLCLAGATLAYFALPAMKANPRSGQTGSITPVIGY